MIYFKPFIIRKAKEELFEIKTKAICFVLYISNSLCFFYPCQNIGFRGLYRIYLIETITQASYVKTYYWILFMDILEKIFLTYIYTF